MAGELKPCPFCGESSSLLTHHQPGTILHPWYRIECDNCGAKGPGTDNGEHESAWNRRTPQAAQDAQETTE